VRPRLEAEPPPERFDQRRGRITALTSTSAFAPVKERLMTARPTQRNTTEIRVNDSSRQKIEEGSLIRFRCQDDQVLTGVTHVTRVTRITHYANYADVFAHE